VGAGGTTLESTQLKQTAGIEEHSTEISEESMRQRCMKVIQAQGGHIGY
jgi:hypothetical protein